MMRSLFSGVSGLKVHQSKMDVIGNNIANVNTVGFKANSVTFADVFYQTAQKAAGANPTTNRGGTNARQIGLGVNTGSIRTNITTEGAAQRTDNGMDVKINGNNFFIVTNGSGYQFTRAGAFEEDALGNLVTTSGYKVMGWQVDAETGDIVKDTVSPLKLSSPENMFSPPEATVNSTVKGSLSQTDPALDNATGDGVHVPVEFIDKMGYRYTANMTVHKAASGAAGVYEMKCESVVGPDGKVMLTDPDDPTSVVLPSMKVGGGDFTDAPATVYAHYDPVSGDFIGMSADGTAPDPTDPTAAVPSFEFAFGDDPAALAGANLPQSLVNEADGGISVNMSATTTFAKEISALEARKGDEDGLGAGIEVGELDGVGIQPDGKIYAVYDNGASKLIGQIAVTDFANPAGLEKIGDNLYAESQNSGEFDGVGKDPTQGGDSLSTGVLEMSNVDLSTEFTEMITTQRGFQANSKIITTSDEMIEQLVNLKR